ncbi:MAG: serpin family protein, partial [Acidobacteriota bacterium]
MAGFGRWFRALFGAREEPDSSLSWRHEPARLPGPQSFADNNNDFALAMYERLRQRSGNLFFSPFSIRTALGMTLVGAKGDTSAQMREALRIPTSAETPHVDFAEIIRRLNATGDGKSEMAVANSLWGQDGAPLRPEFLDIIARHYGGEMNLVDFHRAAEAARVKINLWVEDKTRRKIRDLISPDGIDADTRLVLVNAVYFKGKWVLQFRKSDTLDEPFLIEGGG